MNLEKDKIFLFDMWPNLITAPSAKQNQLNAP